ncbi:Histone-lysine N-methyltransferase [Nymphaea thermarum]|nr:Histone-lysine N-methyltransferase [Nymphaea thermarum]
MQKDGQGDMPPHFKHIERNEFLHRKHLKQKKQDIPICNCKYIADDPESACGERCLNVLTSTECTPGFCPCGEYCKNQRFQKCQYVKTKLLKTDGRGWGLLADENIKAGQLVIEYCGEVITWEEAQRRSEIYEKDGLKDAFIISLDASELVDATRKGSLARFINHSCEPNCVTRKWTVLGELRVGIFARQNISYGTELSYDYNFEWYGGAKVRCLCGAASCSGFLGAKSRGFQEDTYLWEDDDYRFSIENIPLYDSEDDGPSTRLLKPMDSLEDSSWLNEKQNGLTDGDIVDEKMKSEEDEDEKMKLEEDEDEKMKLEEDEDSKMQSQDSDTNTSHIQSNNTSDNYRTEPGQNKSSVCHSGGRSKAVTQKQVNVKLITQLLLSKEAEEEILAYEEARNLAKAQLDSLYDEIRPAIEDLEKDSQDSVSTSVAEKWIEACCSKQKAEFDLYFSIIKNVSSTSSRLSQDEVHVKVEDHENLLDSNC